MALAVASKAAGEENPVVVGGAVDNLGSNCMLAVLGLVLVLERLAEGGLGLLAVLMLVLERMDLVLELVGRLVRQWLGWGSTETGGNQNRDDTGRRGPAERGAVLELGQFQLVEWPGRPLAR